MTIAIRTTVRDAAQLTKWSALAVSGQSATYHIGNLSADRAASAALNLLAETVLLLSDFRYLAVTQHQMRLSTGAVTWYCVTRTGIGRPPKSIMSGACDATTFRAVQAVAKRDADQSVTRAIRDFLGCPENLAQALMRDLQRRGWIEPAEPKGWQVSPSGFLALS